MLHAACFAKLCLTCCINYEALLLSNVQRHEVKAAARCEELRILELLLALGGDANERDSHVSDYALSTRPQCICKPFTKHTVLWCENISISGSNPCCRGDVVHSTTGIIGILMLVIGQNMKPVQAGYPVVVMSIDGKGQLPEESGWSTSMQFWYMLQMLV